MTSTDASTQFAVRTAPYSAEAEQAVLGACIGHPEVDASMRATELLDASMFYPEGHRRLFAAIVVLVRQNSSTDPVAIKDYLVNRGELDTVGGVDYLTYLLDVVPTTANLEHHCRIVKEHFIRRRMIEVGTGLVEQAYEGGSAPAAEVLERAEKSIFALSEGHKSADDSELLKNLLWPAMERIETNHGKGRAISGIPSGFVDLDERLAGFQPGDLILVAARPSMGKTALCLDIAKHAAVEAMVGTQIFSLEMSKDSLVQRMLTAEARVDAHRLRSGTLQDADYRLLATAAGVLSRAPIWIDATSALTPFDLRARARRQKAEKDIGLIIVDYMQLMHDPEYKNSRVQEMGSISRALKSVAIELNVPVIALSQLSRAPEQRGGEGRRPQLSDLRDSGALEQDADVVLFIYRPEMYAKDDVERDELRGQAEVIIAKQRNGPTGTVKLAFHSNYTRFDNYSHRDDDNVTYQPPLLQLERPRRVYGRD